MSGIVDLDLRGLVASKLMGVPHGQLFPASPHWRRGFCPRLSGERASEMWGEDQSASCRTHPISTSQARGQCKRDQDFITTAIAITNCRGIHHRHAAAPVLRPSGNGGTSSLSVPASMTFGDVSQHSGPKRRLPKLGSQSPAASPSTSGHSRPHLRRTDILPIYLGFVARSPVCSVHLTPVTHSASTPANILERSRCSLLSSPDLDAAVSLKSQAPAPAKSRHLTQPSQQSFHATLKGCNTRRPRLQSQDSATMTESIVAGHMSTSA
jgi:hypothetical protein